MPISQITGNDGKMEALLVILLSFFTRAATVWNIPVTSRKGLPVLASAPLQQTRRYTFILQHKEVLVFVSNLQILMKRSTEGEIEGLNGVPVKMERL